MECSSAICECGKELSENTVLLLFSHPSGFLDPLHHKGYKLEMRPELSLTVLVAFSKRKGGFYVVLKGGYFLSIFPFYGS